jgi:osmotically-inducible protein OsmY
VGSWAAEQQAGQLAEAVHGVRDVRNALWVSLWTKRSDDDIRSDIRNHLDSDPWLNGHFVNISVRRGQVELSGAVGSTQERRRARLDAMVTGVRTIEDRDLAVKPSLYDPDRGTETVYVTRSDVQVSKAVRDALRNDSQLASSEITVTSQSGTVVLEGVVDSPLARREAERDARGAAGTLQVVNRIAVRPAHRPDWRVQNDIQAAIISDPDLNRKGIAVTVRKGVAYLSGTVDDPSIRDFAEDTASRVDGVVDVVDGITVVKKT